MVTGATSLSLVRDELFATIEQAELSLESFIGERSNGHLLQQAVESLQQIRGTLSLIELAGAELLAQEILQQATEIPTEAGEQHDARLGSLSAALYVLRRYLENVEAHRQELPEVLLPILNELRAAGHHALLPESFFFSVRLDQPRQQAPRTVAGDLNQDGRRLRHMYQLGLLAYLREDNSASSLRLMGRALARLDSLLANDPRGRLCWIGAAALEAMHDGQLLPRKSRKQLLSRLDRELKQLLGKPAYDPPRAVLKDLAYLVALADSKGPRARELRASLGFTALPFTDHLLEEEYQRLVGPGQAVLRSLSAAIREELAAAKDLLDLIERGSAQPESHLNLHAQLGKMGKTLSMVGLSSAANALQKQLPIVLAWSEGQDVTQAALLQLADAVLYVEGMVASLEQGRRRDSKAADPAASESFAGHQLAEARIVVVDEAQAGLALTKRAITAYLESNGDKMNLSNVPVTLQGVRGGLWFLEQPRAAKLVEVCAAYIQKQLLDEPAMPSEQMLETLADALTSLECYLEGGAALRAETTPSVLDLAEESLRALGCSLA